MKNTTVTNTVGFNSKDLNNFELLPEKELRRAGECFIYLNNDNRVDFLLKNYSQIESLIQERLDTYDMAVLGQLRSFGVVENIAINNIALKESAALMKKDALQNGFANPELLKSASDPILLVALLTEAIYMKAEFDLLNSKLLSLVKKDKKDEAKHQNYVDYIKGNKSLEEIAELEAIELTSVKQRFTTYNNAVINSLRPYVKKFETNLDKFESLFLSLR